MSAKKSQYLLYPVKKMLYAIPYLEIFTYRCVDYRKIQSKVKNNNNILYNGMKMRSEWKKKTTTALKIY